MSVSRRFISQAELENSAVVANNRMNRERNATGINSYERDIYLSPAKYLSEKSPGQKQIKWLDVCCGKGKALIQTAAFLQEHHPEINFHFTGLDLVNMFDPVPENVKRLSMIAGSFFQFNAPEKFDLITCVHGLHYLGDKLGAIQKAGALLKEDGIFIANLDIRNIKSEEDPFFHKKISAWFRSHQVDHHARRHLIGMKGHRSLKMPFQYIGADDQAGPNYTGQEAVDSYYLA